IVEGNSAAPAMRSIRGGSFLCSDEHCSGFRVSARMPVAPTSSSNHTGFRCVKNSKNSKY
ncbi:MAG TPA: formylglycine-generating enzyme family protein, partial [Gammaproteobacteria bacterium]|nr:formylglycine-generating enzyme family protein [Gammaproteobacteria bacterium]